MGHVMGPGVPDRVPRIVRTLVSEADLPHEPVRTIAERPASAWAGAEFQSRLEFIRRLRFSIDVGRPMPVVTRREPFVTITIAELSFTRPLVLE
jgi:hypothetical protein